MNNLDNLRMPKEDRVLILKSDFVRDAYAWLYAFVEENEKITYRMILELSDEKQHFIDDMYAYILEECVNEWKEEAKKFEDRGEDKEKWSKCTLCNQPNRYIHYIKNQMNDVIINVGSDCVTEYGIDRDRPHMSKEQLRKDARKKRRMGILNEKYHGITRIIGNWSNLLAENPILVPDSIALSYLHDGDKATRLYNDYLEEKADDRAICDLIEIMDRRKESHLPKITEYTQENLGKKYVPTRKIVRWLKNNDRSQTSIKWLREDGMITWRTIHRIKENEFMESLIGEFNDKLSTTRVKFIKVDDDTNSYVYMKDEINLRINHEILCLSYGGLLFGEEVNEPLKFDALLEKSKLIKDERNIDLVINYIKRKISKSQYTFRGYLYEMNEAFFVTPSKDEVVVVNAIEFLEKYKALAFDVDNYDITNDIFRYLSNEKRKYSVSEFKEYVDRTRKAIG